MGITSIRATGLKRPLAARVGACLALSAGCLALASGSAKATLYTVTAGAANVEDVGAKIYNASYNLGGTALNSVAGADVLSIAGGSVYAYCVDLFHFINGGTHNYSYANNSAISTSSGYKITGSASQVAWTQQQVNELTYLLANGPAYSASPAAGNDLQTAALQIAIWEVEYDNNLSYTIGASNTQLTSVSPGTFSISWAGSLTTTQNNTLQSYITADLNGAYAHANTTTPGSVFELTDASPITSSSNQSLIYYIPGAGSIGGGSAAPEPGTLALLGGGLAGIAALRRRRT